jgi:hypothetical protein
MSLLHRSRSATLAGLAVLLMLLPLGSTSSSHAQDSDSGLPPPRLAATQDGDVLVFASRLGRHEARRYGPNGQVADSWRGDGLALSAAPGRAGDLFVAVRQPDGASVLRYTLAGRAVGSWELEQEPSAVAVTTDGRVAVAAPDGGIAIYSVEGEAIDDWLVDGVMAASASADGGLWLAIRDEEGQDSWLVDLDQSGEERRRVSIPGAAQALAVDPTNPAGPVFVASVTADGDRISSVPLSGPATLFAAATATDLTMAAGHLIGIDADAFAPNVRRYAGDGNEIAHWRDEPAPVALTLDASSRAHVALSVLGTRRVIRFDDQGRQEIVWMLDGPARDLSARRSEVFALTRNNGRPAAIALDAGGATRATTGLSDAARAFTALPAGGFLVADDRGEGMRLDDGGSVALPWGLGGEPIALTSSLGGAPYLLEWDEQEGTFLRSYSEEGELLLDVAIGRRAHGLAVATDGQIVVATEGAILTFDAEGTETSEWEIDGQVLAVTIGPLGDATRYVLVESEDGLFLDGFSAEGVRLSRLALALPAAPTPTATPDPSASPTPPPMTGEGAIFLPWSRR